MKKSLLLSVVLVLVISFQLSAQGQQGVVEEKETVVLKVGSNEAPSHAGNLGVDKFSELLSERTNGRIEAKLFASAQLGDHNERLEAMKMGTLEMTTTGPANSSSQVPVTEIFDLPFLYDSKEQAFKYFDSEASNELHQLYKDAGYKLLGVMDYGLRHITNDVRPINVPEDLNGLKIRSQQSDLSRNLLAAMGANPVPIAFSELYMAMQQGVVDGQENPLAQIYNSKFYEVQDYCSLSGHQLSLQFVLMSLEVWNSFSEEDQNLIQECATEAIKWERELMQEQESELLKKVKEEGMKVNEVNVPEFRKAVSKIKENAVKKHGDIASRILKEIENKK